MGAKTTVVADLSAPLTDWHCTQMLRWVTPRGTTTALPRLQQRWVRFQERRIAASEWRDVPMEIE